MGFDPNESRDAAGRWAPGNTGPNGPGALAGAKGGRFSRMSSRDKARLTTSARFTTNIKPGKPGKQGTIVGGQKIHSTPDKAFGPSIQNRHAVALQTAKSLDKDFHNARDKAAHAEMAAAIAKHQGAITKVPAGKRPKR